MKSLLAPQPIGVNTPTRVRYRVLAFVCALAMITYLDRACIASAQHAIVRDLNLNSIADLNWVFAAFALAYSLFEVPNGWLGDVFGPRRVLLRIVLWWSLFTALTGLVGMTFHGFVLGGVGTMVVVRFLFGAGEAGAFPNITRTLQNWFPPTERGFAQGAVWMCGRLMGGLTPLVWMLLVEGIGRSTAEGGAGVVLPPLLHWRAVFWLFGIVGLVWCFLFHRWFRNRPDERPEVNAAELALIREGAAAPAASHHSVPWARIISSRNLWLLCIMYASQTYGWYFYINYLPEYLERRHGVPADSLWGAIYKGGPLWLGAFGCLAGGLLTDWLVRRTGLRWGRRLCGLAGHASTGLCFLLFPLAPSPFLFFVVVSLAGFSTDLAMGSAWGACQDIGRRYAAIAAGCMNMIGNLGGALSSWMYGFVLDQSLQAHAQALGMDVKSLSAAEKAIGLGHGDPINFLISASMFVIGILCWLRIDASRPIVPEREDAAGKQG
jgi:MFS transporter, ACS family, glucarate transporter